jgi:two-component system chemotaxis response regulator CheY
MTLSNAGFGVEEAEDGLRGLDKVDESIALVLCDMNMPNMNGIEFLEELQSREGYAPPVLMLTTESEASLVRRARSLGAVGWVMKPCRPESLVATVRTVVERTQERQACG